MLKKKSHIFFVLLFLIVALFSFFRLRPLYFQNVVFYYDQGRDFLKAVELVVYKKPTFIGPTTGISGLFHGAWWYYYLTIPFIIFRGLPIGFYYFNFLIHLACLIGVIYLLNRYFNRLTTLLISLIIAISPYFSFKATFVANNIMAIPAFLIFLIGNFIVLEDKIKKDHYKVLFFTGLSLGLVSEFELSFGMFLIPSYLILAVLLPRLRKNFKNLINLGGFGAGLLLAFIPRIFFELRHGFLQTKTLISFFVKPKFYTPKPFLDILRDRIDVFSGYFRGIFPFDFLLYLFLGFMVILLVLFLRNRSRKYQTSLVFFSLLGFLLFVFSTTYKDTFWDYYYEGIVYLFIFILAILFSQVKVPKLVRFTKIGLLVIVFILAFINVFRDLGSKPRFEGLVVQNIAVDYILSKQSGPDYCVKIYTPPVIPYTYDYLFTYNHLYKKAFEPKKDWVDNRCWFIIESDRNKERREKWIGENIPPGAKLFDDKVINNDLIVQQWMK